MQDIADFLLSIQPDKGNFAFPQIALPKGVSGNGGHFIGQLMAGLFLLSTGEEAHLEAAKSSGHGQKNIFT